MASSNPIFNSSGVFNPTNQKAVQQYNMQRSAIEQSASAEQLNQIYDLPAAGPMQTDRMTYDDTIMKSLAIFGTLLVGAVAGWFIPDLMWVGLIGGLVLGLINSFRRMPSPALILGYGLFEGAFLGAISGIFERNYLYSGIVLQAVIGTLAVFGVVLALFSSGKLRATPKLTKIFLVATIGYAVFSLINWGMMIFGATSQPWGMRSMEVMGMPLGLIIGVFAILLASYSLVLDFEGIKAGVDQGAPRIYGWKAAFGLAVTIVWLYLEILRLLAILRGND